MAGADTKRREGKADLPTALRMKNRLLNNGRQGPHGLLPNPFLTSCNTPLCSCFPVIPQRLCPLPTRSLCTRTFLVQECSFPASPDPGQPHFQPKMCLTILLQLSPYIFRNTCPGFLPLSSCLTVHPDSIRNSPQRHLSPE